MFIFALFFACNETPNQPEDCVDIKREEVTDAVTLSVVEGNQHFAFDLYERLRGDENPNIFLSPYSISTAIGMLHLGAKGETEAEMAEVFYVSDNETDWHTGLGHLVQDMSLIDNCNYQLNTANRAYIQKGFGFETEYVDGLLSFYEAQAEEVDFSGDSEGARQNINSWVSEQTMEKIPNLFPLGTINNNTRLVLTNAIYMNAPWAQEFNPDRTYTSDFYLADGQTTSVEMMSGDEVDLSISTQDEFQLIEIPYKGEELSLNVLLPNQADGLANIEEKLNLENWLSWKADIYPTTAYLGVPKMEMRYQKTLSETLKDMGMEQAFLSGSADFTGISKEADLFVTTVIHEAWLKFSEEGTEAAAATGIAVGTESSIGNYVVLDRPFLFVIEDTLSGSILFMGKVSDPRLLE